jgi:uncharacterized protein YjlB
MLKMAKLTPLSSLKVTSHQIPAYKFTPNTSIQRKPLLIYHSAFPFSVSASAIEKHLKDIDVVAPQWRCTMYSTTHFHTTTHEVLVVSQGKAKLCFGGEENEHRVEQEVEKGDVMVVPAGVGHRLLEDLSEGSGFEMVGSYPKGKEWDMCYGKNGEEEKVERIKNVEWFNKDPVYGDQGPVMDVYTSEVREFLL